MGNNLSKIDPWLYQLYRDMLIHGYKVLVHKGSKLVLTKKTKWQTLAREYCLSDIHTMIRAEWEIG